MVRDYDPVGDAQQRAQDAEDDEELETGSDPAEARRILRKRYEGTTPFQQAQRGFDRHIDDDRLRKVDARAEEAAKGQSPDSSSESE